jgi:hypothetical protein
MFGFARRRKKPVRKRGFGAPERWGARLWALLIPADPAPVADRNPARRPLSEKPGENAALWCEPE